jgi:hypothetical protein
MFYVKFDLIERKSHVASQLFNQIFLGGPFGSAGLEEERRRRTISDWNSSRAHPCQGDETQDGGHQVRATTTENKDDNQRSPEGQRRTI